MSITFITDVRILAYAFFSLWNVCIPSSDERTIEPKSSFSLFIPCIDLIWQVRPLPPRSDLCLCEGMHGQLTHVTENLSLQALHVWWFPWMHNSFPSSPSSHAYKRTIESLKMQKENVTWQRSDANLPLLTIDATHQQIFVPRDTKSLQMRDRAAHTFVHDFFTITCPSLSPKKCWERRRISAVDGDE